MVKWISILLLAFTLHGADTPPLPPLIQPEDTNGPAFYTLKSLAWDGSVSNYLVHVSTNLSGPWRILSVTGNQCDVPHLEEGLTYFICVQAKEGEQTSIVSPPLRWPWPRTNVVTVVEMTTIRPDGPWLNFKTNTYINPASPMQIWKLAISQEDNLAKHQEYEP